MIAVEEHIEEPSTSKNELSRPDNSKGRWSSSDQITTLLKGNNPPTNRQCGDRRRGHMRGTRSNGSLIFTINIINI